MAFLRAMAVSGSRHLQVWITYWAADHPSIAGFRWSAHTWASSWRFVLLSIALYLLGILILRGIVSFRKAPVAMASIYALHNLLLLLASLVMFVGCLHATAVEFARGHANPLIWLVCFPVGTRPVGRVFFWSYAYYLSKYYELLDTVILILRKKPLTFLHVFHHATVLVMCFNWLEYAQSLQIVGLLTNTGVHVTMYSYFLLCSLGFRPSWKKLVTKCQIVQFVFSFVASIGLLGLHFFGDGCSGMAPWLFNAFFNMSLLLLFLNFHKKQYGNVSEAKNQAEKRINFKLKDFLGVNAAYDFLMWARHDYYHGLCKRLWFFHLST